MSYEDFKSRVIALVDRSGEQCNPHFVNEIEHGKFICYLNDDNNTRIIGNSVGISVCVRWGGCSDKGANYTHQCMAKL